MDECWNINIGCRCSEPKLVLMCMARTAQINTFEATSFPEETEKNGRNYRSRNKTKTKQKKLLKSKYLRNGRIQ